MLTSADYRDKYREMLTSVDVPQEHRYGTYAGCNMNDCLSRAWAHVQCYMMHVGEVPGVFVVY